MFKFHLYFLKLPDIIHKFTKIGKTSGTIDRLSCYNTSCPLKPGKIYLIIDCPTQKILDKLEKYIHKLYDNLSTIKNKNYSDGAGREWF